MPDNVVLNRQLNRQQKAVLASGSQTDQHLPFMEREVDGREGPFRCLDRYCRRLKRPYNPITAPPTRKIVPAVPPMTPPATIAPTPTTIRATSWLSDLLRTLDSVETAATLDGASRIPRAAASMVGPLAA
jgi:hypothetical protein